MIPQSEIIIMAVTGIIAVMLPFIFMLVLSRKFKVRWLPLILGIAVFILFALILEQLMHLFVLKPQPDGSIALISNAPWLYVLYGVFAAGIFEETGRLLAFLITKRHYKDIPVSLKLHSNKNYTTHLSIYYSIATFELRK